MSDYIRIFCRSSRPVALTDITQFIEDGVYFDLTPRFDPPPGGDNEAEWQRLTVFYHPEKRPIVFYKSVNNALMRDEIAEISAGLPEDARQRLDKSWQTVAIEIDGSSLTEEAWEMLDSLEAYLAQRYDGIISVDDEGFYDASLQKIDFG